MHGILNTHSACVTVTGVEKDLIDKKW